MTKTKNTKASLISSVIALLLCFAMLLGTTFAWFTDSVTSAGNTIQSGSLKIDLLHKVENDWVSVKENPEHKIFNYDKWEPGYTRVETLKAANLGTLALQYKLSLTVEAGTETNGVNGERLADVIEVYASYGENTEASYEAITKSTAWSYKGTLAEVMANPSSFMGGQLLPSGETLAADAASTTAVENQTISIALHIKESAGNEYQKLSVGNIYVNLIATQWSAENDSFGADYDKDAVWPLTPGVLYMASASIATDADGKTVEITTIGTDEDKASAIIPAGVLMEQGTAEVALEISVIKDREAVVEMNGGDVAIPLDVHIEGISSDNTVPVTVTIRDVFPKNYAGYNVRLFHVENGSTVAMTLVDSLAELDAHNEYYYESSTGAVTLSMATFSEVTAAVTAGNAWNGTDVDTSWYNTTNMEFTLSDSADFAGFAQIVGGMATGIERDSFADKTIKLAADINLGGSNGVIFTPVGYYYTEDGNGDGTIGDWYSDVYSFEGTFDGQGYTISNILQRTWDIKGDYDDNYYKDGMGIFGFVYNGTVKNLAVVGFESDGEFCTTGCVAAYSAGVSTFENIRITDCNPRAYNVPNGGVVGYAYDESEATENKIIFKNVTVDPTTKITALWGSWDVGCGGILGRLGDNTKLNMTDCTVGAVIDVYNDVCANYQYYQYRYCGMLVGTVGSDGDTSDQEGNMTFTNVKVYYGAWSQDNNYYCELVENTIASYTHDYQFSRLTKLNTIGQIKDLNGNWNQTGNFVVIDDDGTATCYHIRKDADGNYYEHKHADEGTEMVDGVEVLVENNQCVHIPFKQFYAGYGWGADHSYEIATVAEAKYTITFMNADGSKVLDVQYITDDNAVSVDAYDDTAIRFLDSSYTSDFGGWFTAGSIKTTEIAAGNTTNYVLYPTHLTKYTARFVDEDGNVINTQQFNKNTTSLNDVAGPASATDVLVFDHWEVRNAIDGTSTPLSDYSFKNATGDITIYPYYEIVTGENGEKTLGLTGKDTDGDGIVDEYSIEAIEAANLGTDVTIPGEINGVPVRVITDLSNGYASNVQNIVIKEGVEVISADSLAGTKNLKTIEIPASVTSIESGALANKTDGEIGDVIGQSKKITITYHGTWEKYQEIAEDGWDNGLGQGSTVVCTNGTATLNKEGIPIFGTVTYSWDFVEKTN